MTANDEGVGNITPGHENMWINIGRSQCHLPSRGTHARAARTAVKPIVSISAAWRSACRLHVAKRFDAAWTMRSRWS